MWSQDCSFVATVTVHCTMHTPKMTPPEKFKVPPYIFTFLSFKRGDACFSHENKIRANKKKTQNTYVVVTIPAYYSSGAEPW